MICPTGRVCEKPVQPLLKKFFCFLFSEVVRAPPVLPHERDVRVVSDCPSGVP